MADRIQSSDAAKMLGVSKRLIALMAARGELPGAAKIASLWTFDPEKLKQWIEEKEALCQTKIQTKISFCEAAPIGSKPPSKATSSSEALEREILKLRAKKEIGSSKKPRIGRGAEIVLLHGRTP